MNKREILQSRLESFQRSAGETPHVYFEPPESVKMVYPCFVYHFLGTIDLYSNGDIYLQSEEYSVRYITKTPDPPLPKAIMDLPYASFESHYTAENLHHFMFTFRGQFERIEPRIVIDSSFF